MNVSEARDVLFGPGVGSFQRPRVLLELLPKVAPSDRAAVLRDAWPLCDGIGDMAPTFASAFRAAGYIGDAAPPPEPVTLYRGVTRPEDAPGIAWTDRLAVARHFAYRDRTGRGADRGYVYRVTAGPEHVLARFEGDRGEAEYVLDPTTLPAPTLVEESERGSEVQP